MQFPDYGALDDEMHHQWMVYFLTYVKSKVHWSIKHTRWDKRLRDRFGSQTLLTSSSPFGISHNCIRIKSNLFGSCYTLAQLAALACSQNLKRLRNKKLKVCPTYIKIAAPCSLPPAKMQNLRIQRTSPPAKGCKDPCSSKTVLIMFCKTFIKEYWSIAQQKVFFFLI